MAEKMIFQLRMAELVKVDNTDFASEEEFVHVDLFYRAGWMTDNHLTRLLCS